MPSVLTNHIVGVLTNLSDHEFCSKQANSVDVARSHPVDNLRLCQIDQKLGFGFYFYFSLGLSLCCNFNLAIKWGEAKKNPMNDVGFLEEPPGRTRFLSEEETQCLIDCASDHLKPIIMTALNTGMRLGEILSLTWDQVHIEAVIEPYIEIAQTKNNKKRFVPLDDDMVVLFQSLKNNDSSYVFLGTHGKELKSIKEPWHDALNRVGISDFRFHDLRHTFASHYIMNGGDLLAFKEILGHNDLKMVERYAHLATAHKQRQINNLNGKFKICHPIATSGKKRVMGVKKK